MLTLLHGNWFPVTTSLEAVVNLDGETCVLLEPSNKVHEKNCMTQPIYILLPI